MLVHVVTSHIEINKKMKSIPFKSLHYFKTQGIFQGLYTPEYHLQHTTPLHWKYSGAEETAKSKRLKVYWPNGVIKVRRELSSIKGICQNPDVASNFSPCQHGQRMVGCWYVRCGSHTSPPIHHFSFHRSTLHSDTMLC